MLDKLDRDEERNSKLEDKTEESIWKKAWISKRIKKCEREVKTHRGEI